MLTDNVCYIKLGGDVRERRNVTTLASTAGPIPPLISASSTTGPKDYSLCGPK